ncbi:uncharacterized protein si:dkeyp-75h12.7 [Centropristis striata]|uniref:uncharacterized protein si:dkeyp-75h12.7 n=1 Tax=Centropristis striata TaxID=184440 RepID=UPI0027E0B654|nr:uncharacterized protein si:dkeyp-75h12.7 [Centropristis striata]
METPGVTRVGVCVVVALLMTGSTGSVCSTTVESLDLGCLLRWDCPLASPNTTYTVQTKTQGGPWQDVPWCVWLSSLSCDVSQAFSNFELYNMIRVGVHLHHSYSATVWTEPRKFDYSDFSQSESEPAGTLKQLKYNEDQLLVKVQFPCASSRGLSPRSCCPVSELIDPWTTVTVYNNLNHSEYQSRTVWSQEVVSHVEFSGFAPGQNYCAVANFSFPTFSMAASPKSAPQCVETGSHSDVLPALCLGVGLTFLLLVPLLIMFLRKRPQRAAATTDSQPKTPVSLPDPVSLVPLPPAPLDPSDIHVEFTDDQICTDSSCSQDQTSTHRPDPLHHEPD